MHLNPVLAGMKTYPFVRLEEAKRQAAERGLPIIDFGVGDPRERTDGHIRQALVDGLAEVSSYPLAQGLPDARTAIAGWFQRRYGVALNPHTEVLPTLGSKEVLFTLPLVLVDARGTKNVVVVTEPGYPVPERGALFAGAEVVKVPLLEANGFLPDLKALSPALLDRVAIFWVNYPNNPTAACAPLSFLEELSGLAAQHDFVLASDEAYGEIYFDRPPVSAIQVQDRRNVAVVTTLSKRSSMTGYRSGAIAASPELIAALKAFRPNVGVAPQEFVQRAAVWAWSDEAHVAEMRGIYAAKREVLLDLLERKHLRVAGCDATFYLWVHVPEGFTSEEYAVKWLDGGIVVSPGSFFGTPGEGYIRIALVPTLDQCRRAAAILEELL